MANCVLGFPNRIDSATLSGGGWQASLPLANLQSRELGAVAQSVDLLTANTQFDIDLGFDRGINTFSAINHNLSTSAQYRLRGSTAPDFSAVIYDSGRQDVWPTAYPFGTLPWGDPRFWTGKPGDDDLTGMTWTFVKFITTYTLARYWRYEIFDSTNSAGCVKIGRIFIGYGYQPVVNMSVGAGLGLETKTDVQEALGGAEFFNRRKPYRVMKFELNFMSVTEGFSKAFELMRQQGVDKEVLFIFDPDDTAQAIRHQFLGRLRQLTPIEYPYSTYTKSAFEIKELL